MRSFVIGLVLVVWAGSASASVCPRLLHAMGVASIERGATSDLTATGSSTGTFFTLAKAEYDVLRRVQSHCEWLDGRQSVPFFSEEYQGLCGGRAIFAVHREAWNARKIEIQSIKALREIGGANEREINFHRDRINNRHNPVLAATLPPLRHTLRKILPRLISAVRAFDSLNPNERAAVVRSFNFVGNFTGNDLGFQRMMERRENFYRGYQVMLTFRTFAIAIEAENESVWDVVERHNVLPDQATQVARAALIEKIKIFDRLDTSGTPEVANAIASLLVVESGLESTTAAAPTSEAPSPARFAPPAPHSATLAALAARWEWLRYRQFSENRRQEAARLAAFPALYRDWDTLAEMEQGVLVGLTEAWKENDPVRVVSLMDDLAALDTEQVIVRTAYWSTLGVIEEHVQADEKAIGKLPVLVSRVVDEMQIFLDSVHESPEVLGMSEYDYTKALEQKPDWARAERIVAAYDKYVGAVAKLNETRAALLGLERAENQLYGACRLTAPSSKPRSIELQLIRQTGRDGNVLINSLETVYSEHAEKNNWSWQRLTETGDNTRIRFRVEGVGVEDFFLREMGTHSLRSRNGAAVARDKEKVYTHEVQVRLVDSSGALRADGVAVRSYNDYADREVVDKRIDPAVRSSHMSWEEFFHGGGLALFDERMVAIEGYNQLTEAK